MSLKEQTEGAKTRQIDPQLMEDVISTKQICSGDSLSVAFSESHNAMGGSFLELKYWMLYMEMNDTVTEGTLKLVSESFNPWLYKIAFSYVFQHISCKKQMYRPCMSAVFPP